MKLLRLTIKNIGLIAEQTIELDKPLILFYGQIQQGKSTILNSVRYIFGGAFPSSLLSNGTIPAKTGSIRLDFVGGFILREFYRTDDGTVKSRPLVFEKDGAKVLRPVEALKQFLNPFLIDQDHLARMTELERRKYFTELFSVNTDALDKEADECSTLAQTLRLEVKAVGELDLQKYERVNVEKLRAELKSVIEGNQQEMRDVEEHNTAVDTDNYNREQEQEKLAKCIARVADLREQLEAAEGDVKSLNEWLEQTPVRMDRAEAELKPTAELEEWISSAAATNVRAEIYEANLAKEEKRKTKNVQVSQLEARQRAIYNEKESYLVKVSEECGIEGLKFLPRGDFEYCGTRAGMLSTSQLMGLSGKISSLYPTGFGLDLIDRAESLGKAIFDVVARAKAENKTILATIVGERPATVPDDVGVFVVEGGKISA